MKEESFDQVPQTAAEREAADWITREDCGLGAEEQVELERWISQSDTNAKAYSEAKWNWEELDRLAGLQTRYNASVDPSLLIRKERWTWWMPRLAKSTFSAACVAFLMILGYMVAGYQAKNSSDRISRSNEVLVERVQHLDLDDGSLVQLNRGARVEVDYSSEERLVRLVEGEANFIVEKDASRPFFVEVSGIRVRAVGTEFNVRSSKREIDVIVTEGTVSVFRYQAESSTLHDPGLEALVEVNQRVKVSLEGTGAEPSIENIDEKELARELLWKPVLIDFENAPLIEIVAEFNRRNPVKVVIVDSSVQDTRLSSMFWSDNLNGLVRLLESNFGIKSEWGEDGTIYLFNNS